MADDVGEKGKERPGLLEAHPDLFERYARLNALFFEAREARRAGGALPEAARTEVRGLLRWVDEVATEFFGEPEARRTQLQRDEAAFALALRFRDDALLVRQVLVAAGDLRSVV